MKVAQTKQFQFREIKSHFLLENNIALDKNKKWKKRYIQKCEANLIKGVIVSTYPEKNTLCVRMLLEHNLAFLISYYSHQDALYTV